MELEDDQRAALRAGSRQVRRAAALLRSVNPESFQAAEEAKRVCDLVWKGRAGEPAAEDVAKGFAGLLRYCPTLGPGAQDTIVSPGRMKASASTSPGRSAFAPVALSSKTFSHLAASSASRCKARFDPVC